MNAQCDHHSFLDIYWQAKEFKMHVILTDGAGSKFTFFLDVKINGQNVR